MMASPHPVRVALYCYLLAYHILLECQNVQLYMLVTKTPVAVDVITTSTILQQYHEVTLFGKTLLRSLSGLKEIAASHKRLINQLNF